MLPVCGPTLWHIVQVERRDDSPQTSLSACMGGVSPPPPTSVTGPGAVVLLVLPLRAAANVARAIAVMAPRAIQVARRRKRWFISELNDAPSADDGCVFECQKHDSAVPQKGEWSCADDYPR